MEEAKLVNSINLVKILNDVVHKYNSSENIVMSCIFKDTKILSYGISKSGYGLKSNLSATHSEIDACNNLYSKYNKKDRSKFGNLDILIIRFSYDNDNIILKNSKPCRFCIKSLNKVKIIKNIYFTENNNIYKYKMKDAYKNIDSFLVSSGDKRVYKY
jgi:hypothetical protein